MKWLILLTLLASCTEPISQKLKVVETPEQERSESSVNDPESFIKSNYKSAILTCYVWVKGEGGLDVESDEPWAISWDIRNNFKENIVLPLGGENSGLQASYYFKIKDIQITDYATVIAESPVEMKDSIFIDIEYEANTYNTEEDEVYTEIDSEGRMEIREGMRARQTAQSSRGETSDGREYGEAASCELETARVD